MFDTKFEASKATLTKPLGHLSACGSAACAVLTAQCSPHLLAVHGEAVRIHPKLFGVQGTAPILDDKHCSNPTQGESVPEVPIDFSNVRIDDLPESLRDLAGLVGLTATLSLTAAFGGTKAKIPAGENNNKAGNQRFKALSDAVGREAALIMVSHYGGETIYVPTLHRVKIRARTKRIHAAYDHGTGINEIARDEGITYRQVEMILKRPG